MNPRKKNCHGARLRRSAYLGGAALALTFLNLAAEAQDPKGQTPTIFAQPIPPTREAQQTKIAKGMSPIDVLEVRAAITDAWTNYSLIIDGDGTSLHEKEWAELTFTDDFKWV